MDVHCSKPLGTISIVVSTGPSSYESPLETDVDYVLRDLTGAIGIINERTV